MALGNMDLLSNQEKINDASLLITTDMLNYPTLSNCSDYATDATWYYKIGTRVFVCIRVKSMTASTEKQIFTLPAGYRPLKTIETLGRGGSLSTSPTLVSIDTSGAVFANPNTGSMCFGTFEFDAGN